MPEVIGITGAAGQIGTRLRGRLANAPFQIRLFDRVASGQKHDGLGEVHELDIAKWSDVRGSFKGLTQIVHLAAVSDEAPWGSICESNITGTYHVFEAARQADVQRVIFASSHHVYGFYSIDDGPLDRPDYRPSGLYGASKCFGEALARTYYDKFAMPFAVLRIAAAADTPRETRHTGVWVSYGDVLDAIIATLASPMRGFVTINVVSDNPILVYDHDNWNQLNFVAREYPKGFEPRPEDRDRRCGGITCDRWFPAGQPPSVPTKDE